MGRDDGAFLVRPATADDVRAMFRVQRACYPAPLVESVATFSRIVARGMSFVALRNDALGPQSVVGFVAAHPVAAGRAVPQLHEPVPTVCAEPALAFVHDLSVLEAFRGRGVGGQLAARVVAAADERGSPMSLVAVQGSERFWARFGFQPRDSAGLDLSSYGGPCTVMTRSGRASPAGAR